MLPLFEMLMKANGGDAMNQMARQFGLNQAQVQSAMEALLPAFSIGLKRNAANPMDMGGLMQAMMQGGHANYFENAASAFNPAGIQAGNDILGQLFGSKDVSRAVTAQAAQATGIGQDILKQMLPAMASMLSGGMQQQMAGGLGAAGMGAGGNVFGKVIEEMMKQSGGAQPQRAPTSSGNPWGDVLGQILGGAGGQTVQPSQAPAPDGNPWGDILGQILGGAGGTQDAQPTQAPADNPLGNILKDILGGGHAPSGQSGAGANPFGKMLEEMMKGSQGGGFGMPQQERDPEPSGRSASPSSNPWGDMFETGKKTQDTYQKGLESIFDQFRQGMDRNR
jgi:hypothetical protein